MTAGSVFPHCAVEDVNDADLLMKWKEITHALLNRGHAAVLYHVLTLRTGYANPVESPALGSGYLQKEASQHVVADNPEIDVSSNHFPRDDASSLFQDESETEDIYSIYDEFCNVPRNLVDDAKDLSIYLRSKSPLAPGTQRYTGNDNVPSRTDHNPNKLDDDTKLSRGTSPSVTFHSVSNQDQRLITPPDLEPAQDPTSDFQKDINFDQLKEDQATCSPPRPPHRRRRTQSNKTGVLRISDKRNLTPSQIPIVANLLVSRNAICDFLRDRHQICENLKPFSVSLSGICSNNLEKSVVTAFETIRDLLSGNRVCRLLSRFASIRLISLIDAYKAVAATDRTQCDGSRGRGRGDATVAIDLYLQAKRKTADKMLERGRILGYCRTGRRWKTLAGRAPILVFMFPNIAETIVYVWSHFLRLSLTGLTGRITPSGI